MCKVGKKRKIVIIGGGIAGISFSLLMNKGDFDLVVCEREIDVPTRGNAFLMHAEGFSILNILAKESGGLKLPGRTIDTFSLKRPDDSEIKYMKMEPWQCIKRKDIVDFLYSLVPEGLVKCNRQFSHFLYENEQAVAAVFKNGEVEYGDLFVGADGARSEVRQQLFGPTLFSPVEVREVVGIAVNPGLIRERPATFQKYLSGEKGLSFGFIPTSEQELVWFMQFDVRLFPLQDETAESLRTMCHELLNGFPPVVKRVLDSSDFSNAYLWHARDFDTLPSFHKKNVVIIGDAAHLALPFTSAGTTNALVDAHALSKLLSAKYNNETALKYFYRDRSTAVKEHLDLGREIKEKFLRAPEVDVDEIKIPLIAHQTSKKKTAPKHKKVHLLYFTDPVCSTCWTIQPQLRKLRVEYADYLELEYCMGGPLPSWINFNRGVIKTKIDAFNYWKSLADSYDMPVNPEVWEKDPIASSYPPAIAFKAAQMQDMDKAVIFLRRLSELLFLKGINIAKKDVLLEEAYQAGLDIARMNRDLKEKAEKLFEEDLKLSIELSVEAFPTFIFTDRNDKTIRLKGYQNYETLENVMHTLIPDVRKKNMDHKLNKVFQKFHSLTTKEFAFLVNLDLDSANKKLELMERKGLIDRQNIFGKETMWKLIPEYMRTQQFSSGAV